MAVPKGAGGNGRSRATSATTEWPLVGRTGEVDFLHRTITESQGAVTIAGDRGQPRTFRPDGRETVLQLDDVPVRVTSTSEGGTLVVVYHVEPNHDLRYSYASTTSPTQLIVDVQFV